VERGWGGVGVNILEDARHSSVFYICKYFVVRWKGEGIVSVSAEVGGGGGGFGPIFDDQKERAGIFQ
jgi:hypothetical protein